MAQLVKNLPASAGDARDVGSIPGSGRSPGGEHGNPLQDFCLENSMDRGTWQDTVPLGSQTDTTEPLNVDVVITGLGHSVATLGWM